ncbi:HK97 family phage prohead protease [Segatella copri]|uniref:HK97 family phage prohead protease n=1 Tax=Segatella copri TaxID=165179 RepID=A0AA90V9Q0_9BACT|nr:HK97 family phage prohead protease [Segatella copri]MQN68751.1 HK97 family phage prohead protease [Segatella copri]MQN79044.1 HK97 family phage prohead protease [Segatella copri]MQO02391.1 HK97 family phage prohead protease [Segatella copri]
MKKKRTIAIVSGLRIREATDGAESRTIEGYALKFGVRSRLLCDWWNNYYEVLEPGCVTREMLDKQDIKLTMFHDRQLVLARSNKGNGTLSYEVDKVGVKFWAEMPHTVDGDKALELVSRGDIAGCSFIYSTDEGDSENAVSYERLDEKGDDGEDILLRHVKRIDNVYDFTITTDPAYEQTDVSKREVEAAGIKFEQQPKPKQIDESKKRERINAVRERIASVGCNL